MARLGGGGGCQHVHVVPGGSLLGGEVRDLRLDPT